MRFEVDLEKVENDFASFKVEVDSIGSDPANKDFITLLNRLSLNITKCDDKLKNSFSEMIINIVKQVSFIKMYHATYRMEFVKVVMRLCNKSCIQAIVAYESLLPLVNCEDKQLRSVVLNFITNDIKLKNHKSNPVELNKKAKCLLQKFIQDRVGNNANFAVRVIVQLFMKNVWTDATTVNILADCCLHNSAKVKTTALKFFLNKSAKAKGDTDSESETEMSRVERVKKLKLAHRVGKKSQARQKHLDRELDNIKRKARSKKNKPDSLSLECNVLAIQQLRDPQMFAEKLFSKVKKAPVHLRMMMLELLSRVISYDKLQLVNFYSYISTFLNPRTADVTNLLVYAAQASHEFVSPDDMQPVVKMIADQFVNEGISGQGIALGLNSIREICSRCPHAMPEELLHLLIEFRTYRDKNVVSATRSLIRLYRELNPNMLPKSERGRPTEANVDAEVQGDATRLPQSFGALNAVSFVPGAEIIDKQQKQKERKKNEGSDKEGGEEADEEYESCSDISDEEELGEWMDVQHSDDEDESVEMRDPAERRRRAEELSYHHIFTDEEHLAIKQHIVKKAEIGAKRAPGQKNRKLDNQIEIDSDTGELVDPNEPAEFVTERTITKMSKKLKATKEEKMESIRDGRVDREKFGFNVNRFNPNSSTTNREKSKKKNYMMVRHKKKAKEQKLSLKQKNKMLLEHIMKRAKFNNK